MATAPASGRIEEVEGDVAAGHHAVGEFLFLHDRHDVAVGQRREVRGIGGYIGDGNGDIELAAHAAAGAHEPPDDMVAGPAAEKPGADGVGDRVAALGERGERGVEPQHHARDFDAVGSDQMQRRIEDAHVDVVVAVEQIDEGHGDVAVRERRDRGRGLVAGREQAEIDLAAVGRVAADLVARGIVALADDRFAEGIVGQADVGPHHDIAAVVERGDLALELRAAVGGVDLRLGLHDVGGGGHASPRTALCDTQARSMGVGGSAAALGRVLSRRKSGRLAAVLQTA